MPDTILALNAGSSSLKAALFEIGQSGKLALVEKIGMENSGVPTPQLRFGSVDSSESAQVHHPASLNLIKWAESLSGAGRVVAVGHRVVHGGSEFDTPVRISGSVLERLDSLVPLAPIHQKQNLAPIHELLSARPDLTQVACFDTAFHRTRAPVARRFALPRQYEALGIERYGFHGLSYEYIAGILPEVAKASRFERVIAAHLGNGASLCALRGGQSVDTTMGFSTLDGVPMGTRCGSIDPGVLLYLMRERGMDVDALEDLLYNQSGLLGLSGESGDMRVLLSSKSPMAADAIDLFTFRVAREIGSLAATLGGLDGLVFTGGIGEHSPDIRREIGARASWLGLTLDEGANARGERLISASGSRVSAWVIPTDEEAMIARHTFAVTQGRD